METDMGKLTQSGLARLLAKPGRHNDGGGLYFRTLGLDRAYWTFRYRSAATGHKDRELSIGPYPEISLHEARSRHADLRKRVKEDKVDPLAEKRAAKTSAATPRVGTPSFGQIADQYVETHRASWKNAKHAWQWSQTLGRPCAAIRDLPVDQVDAAAVLKVLQPIWSVKQETAARLRGRIEKVLGMAKALGHIDRDRANPAMWRDNLDHLLSKRRRLTRGHHPAVPYADIPALMSKLKRSPGTAAKALAFTILTAARTGEALGLTFDEIDLDAAVWTVPPGRMKMQKQHRVPLSDAALDLLKAQFKVRGKRQVYVFESPIPQGTKVHREAAHQPLSSMSMPMVMRRQKLGAFTVHGFRASFRSWCSDTGVAFETAEACLAHVTGNSVVQAYQRSDLLERRRPVLQAWAQFLEGEAKAKVVSIAGRRKR
jgi:integrase